MERTKTVGDYANLQRQLEEAHDAEQDAQTERAATAAERRTAVLEEAADKAGEKVVAWRYDVREGDDEADELLTLKDRTFESEDDALAAAPDVQDAEEYLTEVTLADLYDERGRVP